MAKRLLISLGNRDIQFDSGLFEEVSKSIRSSGKDASESFEEVDSNERDKIYKIKPGEFKSVTKSLLRLPDEIIYRIKLPIIDLFLDELKKEIGDLEGVKCSLLVTDYGFLGDTIYEGEIIKKILDERGFICDCKKVDGGDSRKLKSYESLNLFEKNDDDYFCEVSGGQPIARTAIFLLSMFKDNVKIYEVDGGTKKVFESSKDEFQRKVLRQRIEDSLKNYNYFFVKEYKNIFGVEFEKKFDELWKKFIFEFDDENLNEDIFIERVKSLLDHIYLQFKLGNYLMYIAEVYNLLDLLGYYLFKKCFKIKENDFGRPKIDVKRFEKICGKEYRNINVNKEPLRFIPGSVFYKHVLEKYLELNKELEGEIIFEKIEHYKELFNLFNELKNKRNNSIIAHGLTGVKLEGKKSTKGKNCNSLIRNTLYIIDFRCDNNEDELNKFKEFFIFDKLNKVLIELL